MIYKRYFFSFRYGTYAKAGSIIFAYRGLVSSGVYVFVRMNDTHSVYQYVLLLHRPYTCIYVRTDLRRYGAVV